MKQTLDLFLVAVQFLTRLPVPRTNQLQADALGKAATFFPIVGLLVAGGAVAIDRVLSTYVTRSVVIVIILIYLVAITGGLHEEGLADAADGFGGGHGKDEILTIMHDSRIGSFGAMAIALGLLVRFVFLTNLPAQRFDAFLVAGQVLSRWTALPLGFFLPSAREQMGQGALVAQKISTYSLVIGTNLTVVIVAAALGWAVLWALLAALTTTAISAAYYRKQLGGVTGDCFGATNQITEAAVYFAGVILR